MAWDVEYTDEFGAWWDALTAAEQIDVGAGVRLLEAHGPTLGYPYSSGVESSQQAICASSASNTRGGPIACCTPSIPGGSPCYCSAATKRAMSGGMSAWCPSPTACMTTISNC